MSEEQRHGEEETEDLSQQTKELKGSPEQEIKGQHPARGTAPLGGTHDELTEPLPRFEDIHDGHTEPLPHLSPSELFAKGDRRENLTEIAREIQRRIAENAGKNTNKWGRWLRRWRGGEPPQTGSGPRKKS